MRFTSSCAAANEQQQASMPFPGVAGEWVYELLVGKGAANVRRDPLQRVREDGVPTGS